MKTNVLLINLLIHISTKMFKTANNESIIPILPRIKELIHISGKLE